MNRNMGILGRKIGMTQIFDDDTGHAIPVTAVDAGPCTVMQVKTEESDGYHAVQLGFGDRPARDVPEDVLKKAQGARARYELQHGRTRKPQRGQAFKAGETAPKSFVREFRVTAETTSGYEPGQQVTAEMFGEGDYVDVAGTSKGHGFTGVIKRHGFRLFPKTHGTHEWRRHGGSIGCRKPMRTRRGQRMPGQHGNAQVTVQNLLVAKVIPEQNLILIRGAVPGPNSGYLVIRKALKKQKKD